MVTLTLFHTTIFTSFLTSASKSPLASSARRPQRSLPFAILPDIAVHDGESALWKNVFIGHHKCAFVQQPQNRGLMKQMNHFYHSRTTEGPAHDLVLRFGRELTVDWLIYVATMCIVKEIARKSTLLCRVTRSRCTSFPCAYCIELRTYSLWPHTGGTHPPLPPCSVRPPQNGGNRGEDLW